MVAEEVADAAAVNGVEQEEKSSRQKEKLLQPRSTTSSRNNSYSRTSTEVAAGLLKRYV